MLSGLSGWLGTGLLCLGVLAAQAEDQFVIETPLPAPETSEIDTQYRLAKQAGNRRDFQEARDRLEEVLRLKPDHLEADLSLGVALMVLGESEAGQARLERISTLSDPIAHRAFLLLANQASIEERPDDVIRYYAQAVEHFPDTFVMRYNLAKTLADQERFEEAAPAFEAALMLKPGAKQAWTGLGQTLAELGRPFDAEVCFRRTIALDPGNIYARMYLARILAGRGEKESAYTLYDEALQSAVRVGNKTAVLSIRLEQDAL